MSYTSHVSHIFLTSTATFSQKTSLTLSNSEFFHLLLLQSNHIQVLRILGTQDKHLRRITGGTSDSGL